LEEVNMEEGVEEKEKSSFNDLRFFLSLGSEAVSWHM